MPCWILSMNLEFFEVDPINSTMTESQKHHKDIGKPFLDRGYENFFISFVFSVYLILCSKFSMFLILIL